MHTTLAAMRVGNCLADLCIFASATGSVISVLYMSTNMHYVCRNTDSMVAVSQWIDGFRALVIFLSVLARFFYYRWSNEPGSTKPYKGSLYHFKILVIILGGVGFLTFIATLGFSNKVCKSGNCLTAKAADQCREQCKSTTDAVCVDLKSQTANMIGQPSPFTAESCTIISVFQTAENYCTEKHLSTGSLAKGPNTFYGEQCLAFACSGLVNGSVVRFGWLLACVILVTVGNVYAVHEMNEDEKTRERAGTEKRMEDNNTNAGNLANGDSSNAGTPAAEEVLPEPRPGGNGIRRRTKPRSYSLLRQTIDF